MVSNMLGLALPVLKVERSFFWAVLTTLAPEFVEQLVLDVRQQRLGAAVEDGGMVSIRTRLVLAQAQLGWSKLFAVLSTRQPEWLQLRAFFLWCIEGSRRRLRRVKAELEARLEAVSAETKAEFNQFEMQLAELRSRAPGAPPAASQGPASIGAPHPVPQPLLDEVFVFSC